MAVELGPGAERSTKHVAGKKRRRRTGRGKRAKYEAFRRKRKEGVRVVLELDVGVGRGAKHTVGNMRQGCDWYWNLAWTCAKCEDHGRNHI